MRGKDKRRSRRSRRRRRRRRRWRRRKAKGLAIQCARYLIIFYFSSLPSYSTFLISLPVPSQWYVQHVSDGEVQELRGEGSHTMQHACTWHVWGLLMELSCLYNSSIRLEPGEHNQSWDWVSDCTCLHVLWYALHCMISLISRTYVGM